MHGGSLGLGCEQRAETLCYRMPPAAMHLFTHVCFGSVARLRPHLISANHQAKAGTLVHPLLRPWWGVVDVHLERNPAVFPFRFQADRVSEVAAIAPGTWAYWPRLSKLESTLQRWEGRSSKPTFATWFTLPTSSKTTSRPRSTSCIRSCAIVTSLSSRCCDGEASYSGVLMKPMGVISF